MEDAVDEVIEGLLEVSRDATDVLEGVALAGVTFEEAETFSLVDEYQADATIGTEEGQRAVRDDDKRSPG